MTALIDRIGEEVDALDGFSGFGGSSQGIKAAGATLRVAFNHSELSVECHTANNPDVEHWLADMVDENDPQVINRKGKKVGGRYVDPAALPRARFCWFSPACTHHSPANSKKIYDSGRRLTLVEDEDYDDAPFVASERSRATMSCVLRYAESRRPEIMVVENVIEVTSWGPGRDGSTFRWWQAELTKLGYDHECCFFNSMFFPPCPQSRDRIYIVAWRRGNQPPDLDYRPTAYCVSDRCGGEIVQAIQTWKPRTAAWPSPKWGKYNRQYTYTCPGCGERVDPVAWPSYTAIDWSNLGPTIGERADYGLKPLAPSTMERTRSGLIKFRYGPPIIIPAKSVWGVDRPVTWPFTAQTTQQDKALVVSGLTVANRTNATARDLKGHLDTVVAGVLNQALVVNPSQAGSTARYSGNRSRHITDPTFAVTATGGQALVTDVPIIVPQRSSTEPRSVVDQIGTLATHGDQALVLPFTPIVTEMRGGGSKKAGQRSILDHLNAVTAGGMHHGLLSPAIFQKINGRPGDTAWHDVFGQMGTTTSRDTTGLVVLPWLDQWRSDPAAVNDQMATVMTHLRHSLASIEVDTLPITDEDLDRVHFRMLNPDPELRRAMSFADDYILLGNKTQMTSGLGNAVTPPVATWITGRCLDTLRGASIDKVA